MEVQDNIDRFNRDSKAMYGFYCTGIAAIGVGLLVAFLDVTCVFAAKGDAAKVLARTNSYFAVVGAHSRWWARSLMILQFAFAALMIASAISTRMIVIVTNVVNKHGIEIGLVAYRGTNFLGMTWAATILALLAFLFTVLRCFAWNKESR